MYYMTIRKVYSILTILKEVNNNNGPNVFLFYFFHFYIFQESKKDPPIDK